MGKPVIETGITAHESQADSLKYPFSLKKKKRKQLWCNFVQAICMADSLTLLPLGPTGPTGPGSPFRPWEQKCTIYCGIYVDMCYCMWISHAGVTFSWLSQSISGIRAINAYSWTLHVPQVCWGSQSAGYTVFTPNTFSFFLLPQLGLARTMIVIAFHLQADHLGVELN